MASIQEYLQETPSKLLEIIEKGDRLFFKYQKRKNHSDFFDRVWNELSFRVANGSANAKTITT
ncbi:MAG: hypothetical protein ACLRHV_03235 [Enterococcus gallinarum]